MSSSQYDVMTGDALDALQTLNFSFSSRFVTIMVWDLPVIIKLSYNGITYGQDIEYDPLNMALPIPPLPFQLKSIQIRNKTAGQVGRYQVIAYK